MPELMTWQQVLLTATDEARTRALALWEQFQAGELDRLDLVLGLVVVLNISQAQAAAVADEYTAAQLGALPLGIAAQFSADHDEQLAADVHDAIERGADGITTTAGIVVLAAMHAARHEALGGHGVKRWRRIPEPDACDICRRMADEGAMSMDVEPWHHPGCACSQEPVTDTEKEN